jgi:hypothetical protein
MFVVARVIAIMVCFVLIACSTRTDSPVPRQSLDIPQLTLVAQYPEPVITVNSPDAEGVTYGFEDGEVIKINGIYNLITTEFIENPLDTGARFTRSNIAHWTSTDRIHWRRNGTLLASTGVRTGEDPRAIYAGPLPVYDSEMERWELFYVGYRSQPDSAPYPPVSGKSDPNPFLFLVNATFSRNPHTYYEYSGRIFRAASEANGLGGIGGPYHEIQTVLETGSDSQAWEGLFGDDSFEPYPVGGKWFALYGSSHSEGSSNSPYSGRLMIGLAASTSLNGPWSRQNGNPLNIEPQALENPVVFTCANGALIALYNAPGWPTMDIGYTTSLDGIRWAQGKHLAAQPGGFGHWAATLRTPLGLVPEMDGTYTVFYTGTTSLDAWSNTYHMSVGFVSVRMDFVPTS